jgi:hypothetical protein
MKTKTQKQIEFMKFINEPLKITTHDTIKPSPTTGNGLVARKLAEANEHLSRIKNLDEVLKRYSSPE